MNWKNLSVLRVFLWVIGLVLALIGIRTTSHGGQGGTYTWLGVAIMFIAAFLLIARKPKQ